MDKRSLARTIRTDDRYDFPRFDAEADILEYILFSPRIAEGHIAKLYCMPSTQREECAA